MYQIIEDILCLIAAGIVGGLIASLAAHRLTLSREKASGKATRKRDFLAFMQAWRVEIDQLHMSKLGMVRHINAFFDLLPKFRSSAEMVRGDLVGRRKRRFDELIDAVQKYNGCDHNQVLKMIDELIDSVGTP